MTRNWSTYIQKTQNSSPRSLLLEALRYCPNAHTALDLGAGALNESRYLLQQGFTVTAVDNEPSVAQIKGDVEVVLSSIEEYQFPYLSFDLIVALYVLPFLKKEVIPGVMANIITSLTQQGVFACQFFGANDDWHGDCTTHTEVEIRALLRGMEIIKLEEQEYDQPTAAGKPKHWHVFEVIARKSTS